MLKEDKILFITILTLYLSFVIFVKYYINLQDEIKQDVKNNIELINKQSRKWKI